MNRVSTYVPALIIALLVGAEPAAAASPHHHVLAIDDGGTISGSELLAAISAELVGGAVVIPPESESRVPVRGPVASVVMQLTAAALVPIGVTLQIKTDALVIDVDPKRIRASVNALEGGLRVWMGGPPPIYRLISPPAAATQSAESGSKGPMVVLVHGLNGSPQGLMGAATALSDAGYNAFALSYPNDGRIMAAAHALSLLIAERRAAKKDSGRVALVTTSMGGLIGQACIERFDGCGGVTDFIALSPPFQGSPLAAYHIIHELAETALDVIGDGWGGMFPFDGLGQGAGDLEPGSVLLADLSRGRRRPGVHYSILATQGEILPAAAFEAATVALRQWAKADGAESSALRASLSRLIDTAQRLSAPLGDGAVSLSSQELAGVTDRQVLPLNHLQPLSSGPRGAPIPALDAVIKRLPPLAP